MRKIEHYYVYEVSYIKRGFHSKRYLDFDKAVKAFYSIPSKYSPLLKKLYV